MIYLVESLGDNPDPWEFEYVPIGYVRDEAEAKSISAHAGNIRLSSKRPREIPKIRITPVAYYSDPKNPKGPNFLKPPEPDPDYYELGS